MDGRSPQDPSPRRPLLALSPPVIAAAVGVALVVYQWANARPLWLDEQMIALNIRDRGFAGLSGRLWLDQSAPLGWLMRQRLLVSVLGTSELVLRAVPAAFGAATIVAALYIGERWLTIVGSTVLVLVCAFGQWISFYAIELKSYSADTFFGLLLPALAVAAAIPSVARRNAILLFVVTAALAHWFSLGALLVLPACYAVLVLSARHDRDAVRLLAAGAVVLVVSIGANYLLSLRYTRAND